MTLKTIMAKQVPYKSAFGNAIFRNVPVSVDSTLAQKDFDAQKHEYSLHISVAVYMEREIAKSWFRAKYRKPEMVPDRQLKAEEAYAIMSILGVTASDFGKLVGISKSQVSKILRGIQPITPPTAVCILALLSFDLAKPGCVKSGEFLQDLQPEEPDFDMKKVKVGYGLVPA